MKLTEPQQEALASQILAYVTTLESAVTATDIASHANRTLRAYYSVDFIRKFMKSVLRLSFTKIKPRASNIDFPKVKLIRKLFTITVAKMIDTSTLIINIDESSINRYTRPNYSWWFKGCSNELKSVPFKGSVNIIQVICSNGSHV